MAEGLLQGLNYIRNGEPAGGETIYPRAVLKRIRYVISVMILPIR